jgi:hypothetical protein
LQIFVDGLKRKETKKPFKDDDALRPVVEKGDILRGAAPFEMLVPQFLPPGFIREAHYGMFLSIQ